MTIEEIKNLIANDEHRTLELKKSTGELIKGMQTLCAFLNTDGGWLLFGVTPKLEILGQNVTDNTQRVEKPLNFDPFGQAEFAPLGSNMIDPLKSW